MIRLTEDEVNELIKALEDGAEDLLRWTNIHYLKQRLEEMKDVLEEPINY
jgi:cell division septum initiation protein DivIVA